MVAYCMNHPWLTTIDWPVSAFEPKDAKKQRGLRHVFHRREFAIHGFFQHDVLDHLLLRNAELLGLLGNLLVDQRGAHEAGADHIGADAVCGAFLGDNFRETDQAVLGRDIGRLEHRGLLRVHRAHVDDAAALLLVHLAQRSPRGEERAVEMNCHQPLPFGEFEIDDGRHDLDAGIADEDIEGAECLDHLGGSVVHLLLVGDVHRDADGALAGGVDLARGGIGRLLIEVGDGDLCAFARENDGDLLADAAGRARDDGDLVLQTHGTSPFQNNAVGLKPGSRGRPCRGRA